MAASVIYGRRVVIPGPGGATMEQGTLTFDSDATVEVNTALRIIESATFGKIGTGGDLATPSVDETTTSGKIPVPATRKVTVDVEGSSSETYFFQFVGV